MSSYSQDFKDIARELEESVRRNITDGLLLSGGLDTSIIAYLAAKTCKPQCITVALKDTPAPDEGYARLIASHLGLKHYIHHFDAQDLEESIQSVIRIMKSYDPMEIRNSAAIHIALKASKQHGLAGVMTGDGSDELLAGYSFYFNLPKEQLDKALQEVWKNMRFSSVYLAQDLGMEARNPFLDERFRKYAEGVSSSLKVKSERGRIWGKWILRKAFENIVPLEIIWRVKAPIEVGTGTTTLPRYYNSKISDTEFENKKNKYFKENRITIRSKEHLFYFENYKNIIGFPQQNNSDGKTCPDCGSAIQGQNTYCVTCGAYPV